MSDIIKKSPKNLLICGLPFLLSTYQCKPTPDTESAIAQDLVTKHLDQKSLDLENPPEFATGFEDLDYWELELELAQEMVRLNKQKKFLEDQNELRQKLKKQTKSSDNSKSDANKSTWQATEGVVDALIRSNIDNNKSKTVKRAASKSVEQRMLSAKYNRRGGGMSGQDSSLKPRWMRLVYEMKNRKHHRSNNSGKFRNTRKLLRK